MGLLKSLMKLSPVISKEVDELVSLARNDVNLAKSLCDILESGTPFVCTDVDRFPADPTGDRIFTYQLSDPLKILLATVRARNLDAVNVPVGNGSGHSVTPRKL